MGKNNGYPDVVCENIPIPALGKDKKRTTARRQHASRTSIRDVIVVLRHHVPSQRICDFLEVFFMFFFQNEVFSGEQEKESIIRVRME